MKIVTVLSTEKQRVVDKVVNIADSKLTQCCWYNKSKFYITSDYSGTLSCWSPSESSVSSSRGGGKYTSNSPTSTSASIMHQAKRPGSEGSGVLPPYGSSSGSMRPCRLLYFFKVHTQQITGLAVHPLTNGVYTTSTDGHLKITDIETLSILFTVYIGAPVVIFYLRPWIRDFAFAGTKAEYSSVMVLSDNSIRVWGPLNCCSTITEFTSEIAGLHCFTPVSYSPRTQEETNPTSSSGTAVTVNRRFKELTLDVEEDEVEQSSDTESDYDDEILDLKKSTTSVQPSASTSAKNKNQGGGGSGAAGSNNADGSRSNGGGKTNKDGARKKGRNELRFTKNMTLNGHFVTRTEHDMKIWSSSGKLETILGEDVIFDGVRSWSISLKQQLIACLMDDRSVRFFALTKAPRSAPGMIKFHIPAGLYVETPRLASGGQWGGAVESELAEKSADLLHIIPASYFGSSDLPTSISFVDCVPDISENKRLKKNGSPGAGSAVGGGTLKRSVAPINTDNHPFEFTRESIVVGGSVGSLRWFDIYNEFRMIHTMEEISGTIESVVCNASRMQLFVHARNLNDRTKSQIACFTLPELDLTYYIPSINNMSSWSPSRYLPYVGVGTLSGLLRVYFLQPTGKESYRSQIDLDASEDEVYDNLLTAARTAAARTADELDGDKTLGRASGYAYEVTMCDGLIIDTRDIHTSNDLSGHTKAISAIEFCDELKCIATCSLDCTVKLWTLDKILLRTIRFDVPPRAISFPVFYQLGDLLVATGKALRVLSGDALAIKHLVNDACNLRSAWLSQVRPSAVTDGDMRRVRIAADVELLGRESPVHPLDQDSTDDDSMKRRAAPQSPRSGPPSPPLSARMLLSASGNREQVRIVATPILSLHPFAPSASDGPESLTLPTTSTLGTNDSFMPKRSNGVFNVRRPGNSDVPLKKMKRLAMELPPPKKRPSVSNQNVITARTRRSSVASVASTNTSSTHISDATDRDTDDPRDSVSSSISASSSRRSSVISAPPVPVPPTDAPRSAGVASMMMRHRVTFEST